MTEQLTDKNPCKTCQKSCSLDYKCEERALYEYDCMKKLAEYKTAEEEGRLVVLPYKIGMTLFLPRHREILPFRVVGTRIYTNRTEIDLIYCGNNKCYEFLSTHPTVQYIEREYFHTKEEAQKALEGKEK